MINVSVVCFAQSNRLWASYYGGTGSEGGYSLATDAAGNVYLAGGTNSLTGIASGGFQNTLAGGSGYDAFLVKFDAAGNRVWATYYGGTGVDLALGVTTDVSGNVYLTGQTNSATGIASGGFQNTISGTVDAFLVKFDGNGNRLWATYYGGTATEIGWSVATDNVGNVYLSGWTESLTSIASGGFQNSIGGLKDAFLVKFDAISGNRLWSTYYGGTIHEWGYKVATDITGNVYLAGYTSSFLGIASGGSQNSYGGGTYDAFLVKFDASGNRLWATYYGGSGDDVAWSIATDTSGNVYLAGETNSATSIASGGFQNTIGGLLDVFLVKFDAAGNRLWATYYGEAADEELGRVAVDASGNVYLVGDTYSAFGIASGGFQNNLAGLENQFVVMFDSSGSRLCATYYGQVHEEDAFVAVDGFGNVYMSGTTPGPTGIASGGFQNGFGGGTTDAYLAKFSSCFMPLITTATSANILCNGQCTGSATANPSNGTAPYTYSWNTTPIQTTQVATGLCIGSYTVTVTDATTASTTATITITEPTALTANIPVTTNVSCNALCNGSATVTGAGGIPAHTYLWNTVPAQSTATATGLCATNYTASVTDANGCVSTQTVAITEPVAITAMITSTSAICNSSNGHATITPNGGTGTFTYIWSPTGGNNANATGITAGDYTATVTDASGCSLTQTVTVTSVNTLSVSASSTQTGCASATGTATANPSGGTGMLTYLWSPSGGNNVTATGLTAGNYTVTVTDANACSKTQTVIITSVANTLSITTSSIPTSCNAATGTATVTPSGGTGTLTYAWSPSGGNSAVATGLGAGNYTATVTDANGCTKTQTVTVNSVNTLSLSASSAPTSCTSATGFATANPSGGSSAYTYNWSNSQTTQIATGLAAGNYSVMVTDANGCTQTQTVTVTSSSGPIVMLVSQLNILCYGGNNGSATVNVNAGTAPYTYSWNTAPIQTTAIANGLTAGNYIVAVTDAGSCVSMKTVTITEPTAIRAAVVSNPTTCNSSIGDATVIPNGGTGIFTYSWNPANQTTPIATGLGAGNYTITIMDSNGCIQDTVVTITKIPCPCPPDNLLLMMPNAFSPNSDGENDKFCLQGGIEDCIQELQIIIYNRWGEQVYESDDKTFCWDGVYKGNPDNYRGQNSSVFVYYLEVILTSQEQITKKGNISLVR